MLHCYFLQQDDWKINSGKYDLETKKKKRKTVRSILRKGEVRNASLPEDMHFLQAPDPACAGDWQGGRERRRQPGTRSAHRPGGAPRLCPAHRAMPSLPVLQNYSVPQSTALECCCRTTAPRSLAETLLLPLLLKVPSVPSLPTFSPAPNN